MTIRALGLFIGIQTVMIAGVLSLTASSGLTAIAWKDIWARIVRSGRQEGPKSVRGGTCLVGPGPSAVIWSDRPRLAWSENVTEIRIYKLDDLTNPIWKKKVDIKQNSIQYDEKPLTPGVYQWEAIDVLGRSDIMSFEVMEKVERSEISTKFTTFTKDLERNQVTGNDRTSQKVDFWLKENLLWDAISEAYSGEDQLSEKEKSRQGFVDEVCQMKPLPTEK